MSCERLCVGCEKDIRCSRFLGLRKASGFDLWNELMDWISQNPNTRMVVPKPALYNTIHPFQGSMRRWSLSFFLVVSSPYFGGWHPIWHEGKQVFNPLGIWRHQVWHEGQILSLHIARMSRTKKTRIEHIECQPSRMFDIEAAVNWTFEGLSHEGLRDASCGGIRWAPVHIKAFPQL